MEPNLASRLRRRVTFETPVESDDGYGGKNVSWSELVTVWAEVLPLSSRSASNEPLRDNQLQPLQRYVITIRYREDITTTLRIVYGARTFNIRSIVNVAERNEQLELFVEEGVAV